MSGRFTIDEDHAFDEGAHTRAHIVYRVDGEPVPVNVFWELFWEERDKEMK